MKIVDRETGPGATRLHHPFSMTDEEIDIEEFTAYLVSLPPEALWDVHAHVDSDLYPRRLESVEKEIVRRGLLFISPYTASELRLRSIAGACLALAVLASALRAIGSYIIDMQPWQHLSWFFDLAVGGPIAARMLLPLVRFLAVCGCAVVVIDLLICLYRFARHRLRYDLLLTVGVAVVLTILFTYLSF